MRGRAHMHDGQRPARPEWTRAGHGPRPLRLVGRDATPTAGTSLVSHPFPDMPVLALSGGLDFRTPTAWAPRSPSGRRPGRRSQRADDGSVGLQRARSHQLDHRRDAGSAVPAREAVCRDRGGIPDAAARAPRREADADGRSADAPGRGGDLAPRARLRSRLFAFSRSFRLRSYTIAPRVALSGVIHVSLAKLPIGFSGSVTVSGAGVAHGKLTLRDGKLVGERR